MPQPPFWRGLVCAVTTSVALGVVPAHGQSQSDIEILKQQMQELMRQNAEQQKQIQQLQQKIQTLSPPAAPPSAAAAAAPSTPNVKAAAAPTPDAQEAIDKALAEVEPPTDVKNPAGISAVSQQPSLFSRRVGPAELRLIDVSFDVMAAVGSSTVGGQTLRDLQGGAHDPNQRGFTLQQGELSLAGAVDPYFIAEAHVVFTPEEIELEEAYFVTTSLPWDLQVKGGYFLTDFGRINPTHPHAWTFQDQPFIITRMFGGDGLRSPGLEASWLAPLPWFSQLSVGMQNADEADLTVSFINQEGGIGGRPPVVTDVSNLSDFIYLTRWANAFDITPEISALLGVSGLYGANTTGPDASTFIYGGDATLKWRPNDNFRGWPFVVWQSELIGRSYTADQYIAGSDPAFPNDLSSGILRDAGFYSQLTYGFIHPWAVALRGEYASGVGRSVIDGELVSREQDPLRSDRARISPQLIYQASEFSRLRLQYNYDNAKFLPGNHSANSVWLGIEFLYGTHPAHKY
jgi:hypothetical protein